MFTGDLWLLLEDRVGMTQAEAKKLRRRLVQVNENWGWTWMGPMEVVRGVQFWTDCTGGAH